MRRRLLVLGDDGAAPAGLLVVELGVQLVFQVRPSPRVNLSTLVLWTNAPQSRGAPFRRVLFSPLEGGIPDPASTGDWEAVLDVEHPGCFEFFIEFSPRRDGTETALTPTARGAGQPSGSDGGSGGGFSSAHSLGSWGSAAEGGSGEPLSASASAGAADAAAAPPPSPSRGPLGRFVVHPQLSVRLLRPLGAPPSEVVADPLLPALSAPAGPCEELVFPLAPDGLTLQTQLTRCLGPIDGWLRYVPLSEALREAGGGDAGGGGEGARRVVVAGTLAEPLALKFNMLHFSPPQRLGGSHSCYSLREQQCLDWDLFAGNAAVEAAARAACAAVRAPLLPRADAEAQPEAEARLWAHPLVEGAKSAVLQRMLDTLETQHGVL
jgi:hypothetical protein